MREKCVLSKMLLQYLPISLLVLVACNQIWLHYSAGLSAWSGGGFGMFSTTDAGGNRILRAYVTRPGIRRELDVPGHLNESVLKTLTLPTTNNFSSLARKLVSIPTADEGILLSVIVEVWTIQFDKETLVPTVSLFREFEMQINNI